MTTHAIILQTTCDPQMVAKAITQYVEGRAIVRILPDTPRTPVEELEKIIREAQRLLREAESGNDPLADRTPADYAADGLGVAWDEMKGRLIE